MKQVLKNILSAEEKNYLKWDRFTFAGIGLILICGLKVGANLDKYMDVVFWDESLYLTRGVAMFQNIPKTWGPTYSFWYKLLSYITTDKIELYYFNFKLTTILLSVSFFLFLMACGTQRILAFMLSLFFLSSSVNLPMWPRVSHFCIIVFLSFLIIAKYHKSIVSKFALFSIALLICAHARPELFLPYLVCFVVTIVLFFINIKKTKKYDIFIFVVLILFSGIVYRFLKTPLTNGDSTRGIGVFLQHFAMNYAQWKHSDMVFWLDYADILKENFKDATTLKGMFKINPNAIEHHLLSNISNYLLRTGKIIIGFFAPIFTKHIDWLCLMGALILYGVYFSFTKMVENKKARVFAAIQDNLYTIFALTVFTLPSVFVCIYAYPRSHYLLLQVPLWLLAISLLLSSFTMVVENMDMQKIIVIATVWFFVMPTAADFTYFRMFRKEADLSNQKSVQYIKTHFNTKDTFRVFDVDGGVTNLLPGNFINNNYIFLQERDTIFLSDFLLQGKYDIIYNSPTLTKLNSVKKDSVLFEMLKNPEKFGYIKQKTGNFATSLLIKK
ncbi:MAG: hypothetical protein U0T31_06695 [Chitinophagales bacterium]